MKLPAEFLVTLALVVTVLPVQTLADDPTGLSQQFSTIRKNIHITTHEVPTYASERIAHQHCKRDAVVWLDTAQNIYFIRGDRPYGHTDYGSYVCRQAAEAAGDHERSLKRQELPEGY